MFSVIKSLNERIRRFVSSGERGVTLTELMVGMALFGVVGGTLATSMTTILRDLGREDRLAAATENLRIALHALTSELKLAAHASPYIPGTDGTLADCTSSIQQTADSIIFLISQDDATGANGLRPLRVGYIYDQATQTLFRGEVPAPSVTDCTVPGQNPTSATYRVPMAEKVVRVDYDGDGTTDPIFALNGSVLTVTMGSSVLGNDKVTPVIQPIQSNIDIRNSKA